MGTVMIGVDLGQRRDPTAIAVAERERRDDGEHDLVRHLERLPLGTSYARVAGRVAGIAASVADRADAWPDVYVDATGVGTPVVDVLRAADVQARLIAVYFSHGDRRAEDRERAEIKLGTACLVSKLRAALQGGRLHLPRPAEAEVLATELPD